MKILDAIKGIFKDSIRTSLTIYKVMIPIVVIIKIMIELDIIKYLAVPLAPVMELVGLPAETGLVWAMAIANNLYSGFIVYLSLLPNLDPLTTGQMTVLCTMMLIAHSLPVEARITQKCGLSFWGQVFIRTTAALVCGMVMHLCFSALGVLSAPATVVMLGAPDQGSIPMWAWNQVLNLATMFLVVLGLMTLVRLMRFLKITDLFIKLLSPVLRAIGIGEEAGTITIIGLLMGIVYGGGLIIHESQNGRVTRPDVFSSITLMGLSHGLIEDTALMMVMGASIYGVLWGRLAFSLVVMALFTRFLTTRIMRPETLWSRLFVSKGFISQ